MDSIDLYGNDHKLGDFGEPDFKDLLDQDVFSDTPSVTQRSPIEEELGMEPAVPMDHDWLDSFFEDPVLNDRMMTDALQPPSVKSEHSYSLANGNNGLDSTDSLKNRTDKDMDCEIMTTTKRTQPTLNQNSLSLIKDEPLDLSMNELECASATANLIKTINPDQLTCTTTTSLAHTTTVVPHHILKQPPTIILATTSKQSVLNTGMVTRTHNERSLILAPQVNIKMEAPSPEAYNSSPEHSVTYESIGLPPTPPSSSNSDSEGGLSPQRSAPPSPQRSTPLYRQQAMRASIAASHGTALFSQPIPTSGILVLSEEEKRTLISEGYPIPHKLPLTKHEEKNLKKVRRKIKNKISAQESRRKKKEYLETLEKRVEAFSQENNDLKKKMENLETNNRSLSSQLQKLQAIVGKVTRPTTSQAGTCLMVLTLFFAVFIGTWSPLTTLSVGYVSQSKMAMSPNLAPQPHIQQPQNLVKVMGPEVKDARVNTYDTPNMRSRVLLSIKEELEDQEPYGPHTPLSYRDLFSCFWSSVASDKTATSSDKVAMEPPKPEVLQVDEPVVMATTNHSEEERVYQATMHPDIEASVSTKLLAGEQQTLETA